MPRQDPDSAVLKAFAEAVDDFREQSRLSYEALADRFGRAPSFMWKVCVQRRLTADLFPDLLGRLAACRGDQAAERAAFIRAWLDRFERECAERAAAAAEIAAATRPQDGAKPGRTRAGAQSEIEEPVFTPPPVTAPSHKRRGRASWTLPLFPSPPGGRPARPAAGERPQLRVLDGGAGRDRAPNPGPDPAPNPGPGAPDRASPSWSPADDAEDPTRAAPADDARIDAPERAAETSAEDRPAASYHATTTADERADWLADIADEPEVSAAPSPVEPAISDADRPAEPAAAEGVRRAGAAARDIFAREGFDRLGVLLRPELRRAQNKLDAVSLLCRRRRSGVLTCDFFTGVALAPAERWLDPAPSPEELEALGDALALRVAPLAEDLDAAVEDGEDDDVEPPAISLGRRHRALILARRDADPRSELAYFFAFHNFAGDNLRRTQATALRLIGRASDALAADLGEVDG